MQQNNFFPAEFIQKRSLSTEIKSTSGWPKISIVMPSFNQAKFIERSILSILNQNYPNVQLIIIDGGSSDSTVEILKKYTDDIDYWVSEKDAGQSDALNKGFKKADGEIFGWLNSDDIYLPNAFQKIAESFRSNPYSKIIIGDWILIDKSDKFLRRDFAFDFSLNHLIYEGWHIHPQATFWKQDVHQRFGKFDADLHTNMDFQMILLFGRNEGNKSFLRIEKCLGAWRQHDDQKTGHMPEASIQETYILENRYSIVKRRTMHGNFIRFYFRFRRAYWYWKRGGLSEFSKRLKASLKHLS